MLLICNLLVVNMHSLIYSIVLLKIRIFILWDDEVVHFFYFWLDPNDELIKYFFCRLSNCCSSSSQWITPPLRFVKTQMAHLQCAIQLPIYFLGHVQERKGRNTLFVFVNSQRWFICCLKPWGRRKLLSTTNSATLNEVNQDERKAARLSKV